MGTNIEADLAVRRFAFASDDNGMRLVFSHTDGSALAGRSGSLSYGTAAAVFEGLEGRLDTLRWKADAATLGTVYLRDDAGRYDVTATSVEFPHGLMLVRAEQGLEIVAPEVVFNELRVQLAFPKSADAPAAAPAEPPAPPAPGLRQDKLRFLDSLAGHINVTVKVVLNLPVLGKRTLDQVLKIPIKEGTIDYHALEHSLNWLEGRFLDISSDRDKLAVSWKVPVFGHHHELVTWALDPEATALATHGRVPVRSLADFHVVTHDSDAKPEPAPEVEKDETDDKDDKDDKDALLQSFALDDIDVALSLLAPRNLEVGGGMIMFGGDDAAGLLDFEIKGRVSNHGPGELHGAIGTIDTTLSDIELGPVTLSTSRLLVDGIDHLEVVFDGFAPAAVTAVIHRVTLTNLSVKIAT